MEITIDIDMLREDLKNYYGTAACNVFPAAMMDVWEIDRMSDEEVVRKAHDAGFDIIRYQV